MLQTCYGLFFRIIKCHGGQNKKRLASVYANMKVSAKIENIDSVTASDAAKEVARYANKASC